MSISFKDFSACISEAENAAPEQLDEIFGKFFNQKDPAQSKAAQAAKAAFEKRRADALAKKKAEEQKKADALAASKQGRDDRHADRVWVGQHDD